MIMVADIIAGIRRNFSAILFVCFCFVFIALLFFMQMQEIQEREHAKAAVMACIANETARGNHACEELVSFRRECVLRGVATYTVDENGVSTFTWIKPLAEK